MTLPTGCRPPDPPRRLAPVRSTRRHPPPGDHSATFPDPPTPLEARAAATFARAAQTTPLPKYAIDILAPMRSSRAIQNHWIVIGAQHQSWWLLDARFRG